MIMRKKSEEAKYSRIAIYAAIVFVLIFGEDGGGGLSPSDPKFWAGLVGMFLLIEITVLGVDLIFSKEYDNS